MVEELARPQAIFVAIYPNEVVCVFHTLIYLVYTEESGFIDIATRIHGKTNQLRLRCYMLFIGT